ncbi:glycosyltransferase family 4 protein [Salegentibacter maritimus]|uniref:Glycosyltransferase family 4 protein n=1 Tax=Salegentibacter maritimus TaxID=2794347 RepID=A0ABS0TCL6_9FLAO|nr:glycosyltransferase family 4 protein [Salegentibacter maritimus]MBI6118422.1 glycosyltransferase family 4 protein [Salegentibacter maritimus]
MKKEKKKILILGSAQFGYSTTTYKYCEYARHDFDITYVGWDYKLPKIELSLVKVKYVSRKGNLLKRNFKLLKAFYKEISLGYNLVLTTYVRGISLVKLLNPGAKVLMYVDTFGVMPNASKRYVYDLMLKFETSFFKNVAVINSGLGKLLNRNKYEILPLGGAVFNTNHKSFDSLKLLYVGTFDNRNMIDCVKGFHKFLEKIGYKNDSIKFEIIGDGPNNELEELKAYVESYKLSPYISILGYIPQKDLKPYFENANIGVSYVPILPYYEYQTPTKTFEYLISGLPVIATATFENKKIIRPWSGVIVKDTPNSFCEGIIKLQEKKKEFCSERIIKAYSNNTWENAVKNHFIPLVRKLAN